MKKLLFLALFSLLTLNVHAQSQGTVTLSGQFTVAVWGFSPVPVPNSLPVTNCQPGPSPAFTVCTLPTLSLGAPYSATLTTIGPKTSVACTVSTGTLRNGVYN